MLRASLGGVKQFLEVVWYQIKLKDNSPNWEWFWGPDYSLVSSLEQNYFESAHVFFLIIGH